MNQRDYDYGGGIIVWTAKDSDFDLVLASVERLGEAFKECKPCRPTNATALKKALEKVIEPDVKGHNILVRPLKGMDGRGFVVAQEDPKIKGEMRFRQRYAAIWYNDDHYEVEPSLPTHQQLALSHEYQRNKKEICSTTVGVCLADVARQMGAVPLREAGGVYWLPDDKLPEWEAFAHDIERAGPNKVYVLKVKATPEMIRCVGDFLCTMAETQVAEMMAALDKDDVPASVVTSRKKKLDSLTKQVQDFEQAFSRTLTEIDARLGDAAAALLTYDIVESAMIEQEHQQQET